jgi:hypothetical protein
MVGNPDFLTSKGQEQGPELQELETPEGELYLRFLSPRGMNLHCRLPEFGGLLSIHLTESRLCLMFPRYC